MKNHFSIVDDYIRKTWIYFLKIKANAFLVLKTFLSMLEWEFSLKIKVIRSDDALELGKSIKTSTYLSFEGIVHQTSCVFTPQ